MLKERTQRKKINLSLYHTIYIAFQKTEIISGDTRYWGKQRELTTIWNEKYLRSYENIICYDYGGGCMAPYICQNSVQLKKNKFNYM